MLFVYIRGCRERCYLFTSGGVGRGVICLQRGLYRERCYLFTAGDVERGVICLQQGV